MNAERWFLPVSFAAALAVGAVTVWNPLATVALAAIALAVGIGQTAARRLPSLFLTLLALLLAGYALLGRGFAYVGMPPVFVGEVVFGFGVLAALAGGGISGAFRSRISCLLVIFAAWGAIRTIPYLEQYEADALRDAAVWGYGAFALLVAAFLSQTRRLVGVPELYARFLPWLLLWIPVAALLFRLAGDAIPALPGSDVSLLHFKAGDAAVHLAGAGAFLFLGLHQISSRRPVRRASRDWVWWAVWLAGFLVVGTANRGGMVAILAAGLVVLPLARSARWGKVAVLAGCFALVFLALDVSVDVGTDREVSARQIATNLGSVAGGTGESGLDGTRRWRLQWWGEIAEYTLFGEYFWTGKGFGVNLADSDGFQVLSDGSLRSPHNGHLTILARAGVPGLILWLLLQGAFAVSMRRAYFRARFWGADGWARLDLWVLAYWTAFMVNATFDVYLEGPQGGIWFWSVFGFGIALLEAQRRHGAATDPFARPPASR